MSFFKQSGFTKFIILLALLVCLVVAFIMYSYGNNSQLFNYWYKDRIRAQTNYTLFIGSSSIARMPINLVSACNPVVMYGFNNGTTESIEAYLKYSVIEGASTIVLYIGENDIAQGENVTTTKIQFDALVKILLEMTQANIAIMTIKPSPARSKFHSDFAIFNRLIKEAWMQTNGLPSRISFIAFDKIDSPFYYVEDGIHLNNKGYKLLSNMISQTCRKLQNNN